MGPHLATQPGVTGFENASEHSEMSCFGLKRTCRRKYKKGGCTVILFLCFGVLYLTDKRQTNLPIYVCLRQRNTEGLFRLD